MFKLDWRGALAGLSYTIAFAVFFGLILFSYQFGYLLGVDHGDTKYSAEYHENYAADRIERECIAADDPSFNLHKCIQEEIQASTEHHTAYADLKSQERMAFWAVLMGVATGLTGLITAIGVIFVRLTLVQTNKTNEAAVSAAKAANKANDIMREETRPWVSFERAMHCEFQDFGYRCRLVSDYTFKNMGKTPAYDIRINTRVIQRNNYQNFRPQILNFVDECKRSPSFLKHAVAFPGERMDFRKYGSEISEKYQPHLFGFDDDFFGPPTLHILLVCVTYRTNSKDGCVGYDGRVFQIEESRQFIGPFGHELMEHAEARVIG